MNEMCTILEYRPMLQDFYTFVILILIGWGLYKFASSMFKYI